MLQFCTHKEVGIIIDKAHRVHKKTSKGRLKSKGDGICISILNRTIDIHIWGTLPKSDPISIKFRRDCLSCKKTLSSNFHKDQPVMLLQRISGLWPIYLCN